MHFAAVSLSCKCVGLQSMNECDLLYETSRRFAQDDSNTRETHKRFWILYICPYVYKFHSFRLRIYHNVRLEGDFCKKASQMFRNVPV